MRTKLKLGLGAPLTVFGALALILIPIYGLYHVNSLLELLTLTICGVATGLGIALSISGIIDLKSEKSEDKFL
jgi:hypothetical protein